MCIRDRSSSIKCHCKVLKCSTDSCYCVRNKSGCTQDCFCTTCFNPHTKIKSKKPKKNEEVPAKNNKRKSFKIEEESMSEEESSEVSEEAVSYTHLTLPTT
eukprot:TRINITY_DN9665_c0_g2_i1.p1 TRINITY_DN9665_c0_g2~~TRINITY_DN9665_c0_g2_i1.p1  ORF type:complete len:101 (+),score=16.19 TRINITY_DN9665_c0_g2_i1:2-304(+)